ncbi:hypothetical protein BgiMline_025884, partial [Biomphalaria glabrata]
CIVQRITDGSFMTRVRTCKSKLAHSFNNKKKSIWIKSLDKNSNVLQHRLDQRLK